MFNETEKSMFRSLWTEGNKLQSNFLRDFSFITYISGKMIINQLFLEKVMTLRFILSCQIAHIDFTRRI